jgi:anti-sigma B factor antagonist
VATGSVFWEPGSYVSQEPAAISASGLRLQTDTREDATVIRCIGRLTSDNTEALKTRVRDLIPHAKRVVLDLNELVRMDSAGLGAMVGLYVSAKKANCELLLVNYNKSVRDLLGLTNLLSVFEDCARAGMRIP